MRLTLRTLLAYLDDVLEPGEAREIGQKIQDSPVAAALVSRIREVMRRRRLTAPDIDGPEQGVNPNIVAQYLDNSLTDDLVADMEKVCLESDVQLAEVAACHQILTLVLGEPADVSSLQRERLLALCPGQPVGQLDMTPSPPNRNPKPAPSPASATGTGGEGFEDRLPEFLKPSPWPSRVLPLAAVVLLVVVWIGMVVSDQQKMSGLFQPALHGLETPAGSQPVAVRDAAPAKSQPPVKSDAPTEGATGKVVATGTAGVPPRQTEPTEVAVTTPAPVVPESPVPAVVESKSLPPMSAKPVVEDSAAPVPAPPPPAVPAVPVSYVSSDGILLQEKAADNHWSLTPRQGNLEPGDQLAALEPFEALLSIDSDTAKVTLLGDTLVQLMGPTRAARVGLGIHHGRVVLQSGRREDRLPVEFAIAAGQDLWKLELLAPETVIGIEVEVRETTGVDQDFGANGYLAECFVLTGAVRWAGTRGQSQQVDGGHWFRISPGMGPMTDRSISEPIPLVESPDWLDPQRRKLSSALRRYADLFEKELAPADSVEQTLGTLAGDSRPKISELATRGLATMEDYPLLVTALAQSSHEESRFAARDGLRRWLASTPGAGATLSKELELRYPPAEAAMMLRLLWGYSDVDARNRATSLELVELLRSPRTEFRELAFFHIVRLTGQRHDYRPLDGGVRREPGVRRWLDHIEREGALVKSEPQS